MNTIVYTTMEIVRKICIMLFPIIPESTLKALKIFDLNENDIIFKTIVNHRFLKNGKKINKIEILFKKVERDND